MVCGCYRAGTTSMAAALNRHKDIFCTSELDFFDPGNEGPQIRKRMLRYWKTYPKAEDGSFIPSQDEQHGLPEQDKYLDTEGFFKELETDEKFDKKNFVGLVNKYRSEKPKIYGDKLPNYIFRIQDRFDYCKDFFKIYPKVIFMYRDPRDVIESQVRSYWRARFNGASHKQIMMDMGHRRPDWNKCLLIRPNWKDYMYAWNVFKDEYEMDYFELRYERLLIEPTKVALELSEFLKVDKKEMEEVMIFHFSKGRSNIGKWKEIYPELTDYLPKNWVTMMREYGIPYEIISADANAITLDSIKTIEYLYSTNYGADSIFEPINVNTEPEGLGDGKDA